MNSDGIGISFKKISSYIRTIPSFYSILFSFSFIDIKKLYIWMINITNKTLPLN